MIREQFEHAVRAAGAVLGVTELLVIGSQDLHGGMSGPLRIEAARSVEVDVAVHGDLDGRLAELIDGSIGEASIRSARIVGAHAAAARSAMGGAGTRVSRTIFNQCSMTSTGRGGISRNSVCLLARSER